MARPTEKEAKNLGYTSITIRMDHVTISKIDSYCKSKKLVRSDFIRKSILEALKT